MAAKSKTSKLFKLIREFANAQEAESWKGGGDPDNIPAVETRLDNARRRLNAFIHELNLDNKETL